LGVAVAAVSLSGTKPLNAQIAVGGSHTAPIRLTQEIDNTKLITLTGQVRRDLTPDRDLGPVSDSKPLRLYLALKRSPEQQIELDTMIARQQQPGAPEYHKWLTPKEFGERFGLAEADIAKISKWLESQGFEVKSVLNNASVIDFAATAGGVRKTFHTQMHNWNIQGGEYAAIAQEPMIPAALQDFVAQIVGLNKIPPKSRHTPIHPVAYNATTHRWNDVDPTDGHIIQPNFADGSGSLNVTPQDFYTIYNVNKVFNTGNLGAAATIAVPEPTDMNYGTVNASTGAATGGDVATFRNLFGVAGTLKMQVLHGYGTVTCNDPGTTDAEGEATLDAEWSNATAPAAKLIFMSCDTEEYDGVTTAFLALIDGNLADAIGSSYGSSELLGTSSGYSMETTMFSQAASQGQTVIVAEGDAGSDDADQNTSTTATPGLNVDDPGANPHVLSAGGTDFSDHYDADEGGLPQSTYWASTNSAYYGNALSYIPETVWNASCASSIIAYDIGNHLTPQAYCGQGPATNPNINGSVIGGGGGYSTEWAQPSWQAGTPGLSAAATKRAVPDIALFAANGFWGHALIDCDSHDPSTACTSSSTFGSAGGTSFVSPQLTGITGLLVTSTGSRQGMLNPAIYALAKAQYTAAATKSACYSNGQTSNIGVTSGLPASQCIFNDVTTSNNDVPCQAGSTNCYVSPSDSYGLLSTTGASSLTVGYPAAAEYDLATGLGSINVYNLITNWSQAFTSNTALTANPTSITPAQSTKLTATVTTGTPPGSSGAAPPLTGKVTFNEGSTSFFGTCTLSGGTCAISVSGSDLEPGSNSITATFSGSGTYPASTSSITTVTNTGSTGGPPAVVSLSPTSASGAAQTFTAVYSDPNGTSDLKTLRILLNTDIDAANGCYVLYNPATSTMSLENTAGNGSTSLTLPTSSSISNGQCTLNGSGTTVSESGNNVTVTYALSFGSTFSSPQNVYLLAGSGYASSGWVEKGTFMPPDGSPMAVSVSPVNGTGATQAFTATYSDTNGASDLKTARILFNTAITAGHGCYVQYNPVANTMSLENDAGTGPQGSLTPGSGSVSNNQCTLTGSGSSVSKSGNNLTVVYNLSFSSTFTATENVYVLGGNNGVSSGWVLKGTWKE
jgi:hypothetical protein